MKDKDEEKGMGTGEEHAEERVEGKGKAQEGTKGEEKPNEREKEDAGDESVFDVDPPHGGKQASALVLEDVVDPQLWIWTCTSPWTPTLPWTPIPTQQKKTSQTRQNTTSLPSAQHSQPAKKS